MTSDKKKKISEFQYLKYTKGFENYKNYISFDLEFTGFNHKFERIFQIGAVRVRDGETLDSFNQLVKPDNRRIRDDIVELTGITNEKVKDCPTIDMVLSNFIEFIGDDKVLVAHNAPTDMKFLLYNMYKLEMDKIDFIVVDTLEFSKNYIKDNDNKKLKSYSLENLKELFNLDVYRSHDALDDSYACVAIFEICKSNSIEKVKNLITKLEYLQKLKGRHTKSITKLINAINNLVVLKSSKK